MLMHRILLSFLVLTVVSCGSGTYDWSTDQGASVARVGLRAYRHGKAQAMVVQAPASLRGAGLESRFRARINGFAVARCEGIYWKAGDWIIAASSTPDQYGNTVVCAAAPMKGNEWLYLTLPKGDDWRQALHGLVEKAGLTPILDRAWTKASAKAPPCTITIENGSQVNLPKGWRDQGDESGLVPGLTDMTFTRSDSPGNLTLSLQRVDPSRPIYLPPVPSFHGFKNGLDSWSGVYKDRKVFVHKAGKWTVVGLVSSDSDSEFALQSESAVATVAKGIAESGVATSGG